MAPVRLEGVRVVVFDLDDTLYPEQQYVFSGFEAVSRWLRARMLCPVEPGLRMRELFEGGERRHVFDALLRELACAEASEWVPKMVACYREHTPSIRLFPDAEESLRGWAPRVRMGLITDGHLSVQQRKVDALGLAARLDPIVLTDQWGIEYWKPHKRAFEFVETASGARGCACVYIADNPEKDFLGPQSLGWQTVRVRRPAGLYSGAQPPPGVEPQWTVETLAGVELVD